MVNTKYGPCCLTTFLEAVYVNLNIPFLGMSILLITTFAVSLNDLKTRHTTSCVVKRLGPVCFVHEIFQVSLAIKNDKNPTFFVFSSSYWIEFTKKSFTLLIWGRSGVFIVNF